MDVPTQSVPRDAPWQTQAPGPVAESSAPPTRPALKRGDDTLTGSESLLLLSALATLAGVVLVVFFG